MSKNSTETFKFQYDNTLSDVIAVAEIAGELFKFQYDNTLRII